MEIPKTLWLKKHMPSELFSQCQFFDLPDYLTYRATGGSTTRSACSVTCKCSFVPRTSDRAGGWQDAFFEQIGLGEFVKNGYAQIGPVKESGGKRDTEVLTAGLPVGSGLSSKAAQELGLNEGTTIGSAVIDAYVVFSGIHCQKDNATLGMLAGSEPLLLALPQRRKLPHWRSQSTDLQLSQAPLRVI